MSSDGCVSIGAVFHVTPAPHAGAFVANTESSMFAEGGDVTTSSSTALPTFTPEVGNDMSAAAVESCTALAEVLTSSELPYDVSELAPAYTLAAAVGSICDTSCTPSGAEMVEVLNGDTVTDTLPLALT